MVTQPKRRRDDAGHYIARVRKRPKLSGQDPSPQISAVGIPNVDANSNSLFASSATDKVLPLEELEIFSTARASWLPAPDDAIAGFDSHEITVHSASKISKLVARSLNHLNAQSEPKQPRPVGIRGRVVVISVKAPSASKAITICEIVKRERVRMGRFVVQYSKIDSMMEKTPRQSTQGPVLKQLSTLNATPAAENADSSLTILDDESQVFETMLPSAMRKEEAILRNLEGKPKIRATPILTIFLSDTGITKLKALHGGQKPPTPLNTPELTE